MPNEQPLVHRSKVDGRCRRQRVAQVGAIASSRVPARSGDIVLEPSVLEPSVLELSSLPSARVDSRIDTRDAVLSFALAVAGDTTGRPR